MAHSHLLDVKAVTDKRGALRVVEYGAPIPFVPVRVFWITDVPHGTERGGHSHQFGQQALFCVAGSVTVRVDDFPYHLSGNETLGVLLNPGETVRMSDWSEDAVLLVLASRLYGQEDG